MKGIKFAKVIAFEIDDASPFTCCYAILLKICITEAILSIFETVAIKPSS